MATLKIIRWRDMPAQVTAKEGRRTAKRVLHRRFQVAIDRAAMRAGKRSASDYIGEWVSESRPCGDDLEAEVTALAEQLEAEHPRETLERLVANGGWRDPSAHPPDTAPDPADADAGAPADAETADADPAATADADPAPTPDRQEPA